MCDFGLERVRPDPAAAVDVLDGPLDMVAVLADDAAVEAVRTGQIRVVHPDPLWAMFAAWRDTERAAARAAADGLRRPLGVVTGDGGRPTRTT